MSSHSRPIWGICTTWSMSHRLVKPASSAATATSASVAAVVAGWPGQSKRETCRPKSSVIGSSRWRAGGGGGGGKAGGAGGQEGGRHEGDRPGAVHGGEALGGEAGREALGLRELAGDDAGRHRLA